jgi:hypothetical protein
MTFACCYNTFAMRNGEMAKWRNGEMAKWRNGEIGLLGYWVFVTHGKSAITNNLILSEHDHTPTRKTWQSSTSRKSHDYQFDCKCPTTTSATTTPGRGDRHRLGSLCQYASVCPSTAN